MYVCVSVWIKNSICIAGVSFINATVHLHNYLGAWSAPAAERYHGSAKNGPGVMWQWLGHNPQMYLFFILSTGSQDQGKLNTPLFY